MRHVNPIQLHSRLLALVLLSIQSLLHGQDADDLPVHDLDPYLVEARETGASASREELVETGRSVLPETGEDRSVFWISRERLTGTAVARIEDLFWQVPGAASQARFGVITVPTIRGDAAETLFNGQRRGDNLFGLPPTLTAIDSVEVVTGAPILRSGLGKRTGGQVNLATRQAIVGMNFGSAELRLGTWVPGAGDYGTLEATLDLNRTLGKGQALRVAAGFREDETFYKRNGGHDDYRDLYLSWRFEGDDGETLDLIGYTHTAERPQTLGVNRPWQGLIDNNQYVTGGVDPLVGQSDPPGFLDPGIVDPGLIVAGTGDVALLEADRVLMSAGDIGEGKAHLGQVIYRKPVDADLLLHQAFLIERVFREKENQFFFAEDVEQLTLDSLSRLMGEASNRFGQVNWELGVHLRLEERSNRTNYWNEFAYAFDIREGRRFSVPERFPAYLAPGAVEDNSGRAWYLPSSPFSTPETTDSRLRQAGTYGQFRQEFARGWSLALTLRGDWIAVDAREPGDLTEIPRLSDRETVQLLSGSLSLQREFENGTVYLTAGQYRGVAGNTVGDGVNLYGDGRLHRDDFLNRARLLEIGGRHQVGERGFLSWSVFDQRRKRLEFFGSNDITVHGAEISLDWQPTASTRLYMNGQYLDARYDNAAPAEFGGGSLWNVYAPGAGPTGQGNGLGYIGGFFLNSVAPGDARLPGLSKWQMNAGIEQELGDRWSLWVWGGWSSEQRGNLAGEYFIPSQMEWNASLTYRTGKWEAQLVARNLFDAGNWLHNGDTFFNQMLISRNLPLRLEGRFRIRF
jgi:hypothetical protein